MVLRCPIRCPRVRSHPTKQYLMPDSPFSIRKHNLLALVIRINQHFRRPSAYSDVEGMQCNLDCVAICAGNEVVFGMDEAISYTTRKHNTNFQCCGHNDGVVDHSFLVQRKWFASANYFLLVQKYIKTCVLN